MAKFPKGDPRDWVDDKEFEVDQSGYADNTVGITARAHDIMNDAHQLSSIISTLEAVNMDRLANRVAAIQQRILQTAEPIPRLVMKDLDESIAHGKHMMGGILQLALAGKLTG